MPRNGSGVYTLPNASFVSGTVIASAPVNGNFSDIASALTQSISLDGQTTLTGAIKFLNGTAAAPGVAFAGDSSTGIYLSSAGVLGLAANGGSVGTWSSSGLSGATLSSPTISSPTVTNGTFSNPTATGTLTGAAATFSGTLTANGSVVLASPLPIAQGGTGDTSFTAYAVTCGGTTSTGALQSVASVGAAGQVLTSNGAGALPTFQSPGMVLLNTLTASNSATLSDTTSLTSTYSKYLITFENIVPVSNTVSFNMATSTNGGSSYASSSYVSGGSFTAGTINTWTGGTSTSAIFIIGANTGLTLGNLSGYGASGQGIFYNPSGSSTRKYFIGNVAYIDQNASSSTSNLIFGNFFGYQDSGNTAINAIQFSMSSGNISSGTIHIYGIP